MKVRNFRIGMTSLYALMMGLSFQFCKEERRPATPIVLPPGYEVRYYQGMRYGLFVPPSYDAKRAYPLVIYLHGSTDTTSWDLKWYHEPFQSEDPCFVLTPKTLVRSSGWGNSWKPGHSKDMQKTLKVIELIRKEFNIDPDRIYIHGTSMGGFGAISALAKEPGLFAAGFSICGGGDPHNIKNLINTPLWLFHGSDDDVVPVTDSRELYLAIKAAGGKVIRYTEYPGVRHAAWEPAGKEPTLYHWLLAQRKGAQIGPPEPATDWEVEYRPEGYVQLSWRFPSDQNQLANRIWFSRLYRDGQALAELDNVSISYIDSNLTAGSHTYTLVLVNYYFQESPPSAPVTITIIK